MRSFRLVYGHGPSSDTGEEVDYYIPLDGTDGLYFLNPEGLGYTESVSAGKVVSGFSKVTNRDIQWPNITGTLYITKLVDAKFIRYRIAEHGVYHEYTNFMRMIHSAEHLYLDYSPDYSFDPEVPNNWFRTEVALMSIDKSEITTGDTLQCKMTLARLTPWYKLWPIDIIPEMQHTNDISADLKYVATNAGGRMPSCVTLDISNVPSCDRLELTMWYRKTSTSAATYLGKCIIKPDSGKFSANKVFYSSKYDDVLVLVDGSNAIDKVDVSQQILLRGDPYDYIGLGYYAELGVSISAINPTGTVDMTAEIKQYDYYRSV